MSSTKRGKKKESGAARSVRLGLTGDDFLRNKYGHEPLKKHARCDKTWRDKQAVKRPAASLVRK